MRRTVLSLAAGAAMAAGGLWSGAAPAQPAEMDAFDAQEAARGRPSLAWSRPADGGGPGAPLPQTYGQPYGGGYAYEGGVAYSGSGVFGGGFFGGGRVWGGSVLLGPIIISPDHRPYGLRPGHRPRPGARPYLYGERPKAWRKGFRRGHRKGYRQGLRHGLRQNGPHHGHAAAARPWAPGGLYAGGSVHARRDAQKRNAAKLRRARNWTYY